MEGPPAPSLWGPAGFLTRQSGRELRELLDTYMDALGVGDAAGGLASAMHAASREITVMLAPALGPTIASPKAPDANRDPTANGRGDLRSFAVPEPSEILVEGQHACLALVGDRAEKAVVQVDGPRSVARRRVAQRLAVLDLESGIVEDGLNCASDVVTVPAVARSCALQDVGHLEEGGR